MSDRATKEQVVQEIVENIENSSGIVIVDYRGLNVKELTELRSQYRQGDVNYKVYKNTLVQIAFNQKGIEGAEEILKGPNAFAFGINDPVSVSKVTSEFAKKNDKLEIKAGIIDGKVVGKDQVEALAKLPSEEELRGMTVNVLNAPIQNFAGTLSSILSSLVYVVSAVKDKKEEEAA